MSTETVDVNQVSRETGEFKDYGELRFQERLAKLSEELNAKVDKKIQERLDSDRNFVSTMVGNGVKLLGYAVALVTIIIGIAGVKSCSDINHAIAGAATDAVNRKLETENPNSDFNRLTNRLLNRALLDSYLTSLARFKSQYTADRSIRLQMSRKFPKFSESQDAKRLTQMLFDSSTDTGDFKDVLQILDYTGSLGSINNLDLNELALAEDNKYSWIRGVPEKRIELIKKIKNQRILPVLQKLITNENNSEVKIAAIQAVGEYGDDTTRKPLEELATKETTGPFKDAAIFALARYNPQHSLVTGWVEDIKKGKADAYHQSKLLLLALEIMKGRPKNVAKESEGSDEKVRPNLAKALLSTVIEKGFRLVVHPLQSGLALVPAKQSADQNTVNAAGATADDFPDFDAPSVPVELLFGAGAEAVASLFEELAAKNDLTQLAKAVDALSLRDEEAAAAVVEVELGDNSSIKLKDNSILDTQTAPNGVKVETIPTGKNAGVDLWALWNDATGAPQKRIIVSFDHPETMTFKLSEVNSSSSSEK
jgi:hypothetical protein